MPSTRYRTLSRRVSELRRNLLPANFNSTGLYSDRVHERTRAFRVLAHAEFEAYIEDRVIEVVHRAHLEWNRDGTIRPCLLALMSHRDSRLDIPDSLTELRDRNGAKYPTLKSRVEAAKRQYSTYVRTNNNGIKERNLLLLLLPLGVTKEEIDTEWLNDTEVWATARGEVAHTSAKMQIQVDPRVELSTVKNVLDGFKLIDGILEDK
ncbi:HEPN domain-containing protein [Streptomyces sp. NPDC023838]|uniref:HEPN domain-containing protein n=1 Tax=Streptomyces sp. NPDC023838 TaxID=3154325 RepID=UPI0033E702AC